MLLIGRIYDNCGLIGDDRFLFVREGSPALRRLARFAFKYGCDDVIRGRVGYLCAFRRYVAKCFGLEGALGGHR